MTLSIAALESRLDRGGSIQAVSSLHSCEVSFRHLEPCIAVALHSGGLVPARFDDWLDPSPTDPGTDQLARPFSISMLARHSSGLYDLSRPQEEIAAIGRRLSVKPSDADLRWLESRHREFYSILNLMMTHLLDHFPRVIIHEFRTAPPNGRKQDLFRLVPGIVDMDRWGDEVRDWRKTLEQIQGRRVKGDEEGDETSYLQQRFQDHSNVLVLTTVINRDLFWNEGRSEPYPIELQKLRTELLVASRGLVERFRRGPFEPTLEPVPLEQLEPTLQKIDRKITRLNKRISLLRHISPTNSVAQKKIFLKKKGSYAPRFTYRPLEFDPDLFRRELYRIKLEEINDPVLELLYRNKMKELAAKLQMLEDRGSEYFLPESQRIYGRPDSTTLRLAHRALALPEEEPPGPDFVPLTATKARAALRHRAAAYSERFPDFKCKIQLEPHLTARAMVQGTTVYLKSRVKYSPQDLAYLDHHELGVHVVSHLNGNEQPLKLLSTGLPFYQETQEGLAVTMEIIAGAATSTRLRNLGARALAIHRLLKGDSFPDIYQMLTEEFEMPVDEAYRTTERTFRGGGLAKDHLYLSGLAKVLEWIRQPQNDISLLFIGKVSLSALPYLRDLVRRDLLRRPKYHPLFIDTEGEQWQLPNRENRSMEFARSIGLAI